VKGRDSSISEQSSQDELDQSLLPVVLYPHRLNDDGELPNIEVAVGSDYPPDFRCVLEIFAPRGMQSHQLLGEALICSKCLGSFGADIS
jgi:hypothetical protein